MMKSDLEQTPLIVIAGPTAVGKSALGIALAQSIGGQIISADSMQVYRQMDIGTAKVSDAEMEQVKHHLINICDPTENFHVFDFKKKAQDAIGKIVSEGDIPIVVGGTGFYIQALLYDIDFSEEGENSSLRESLQKIADTQGHIALHQKLSEIDPLSAQRLHPNDVKRVIRAIEYKLSNNDSITDHNNEQRKRKSPYNFYYFVLTDDRAKIYERIDDRVEVMVEDGLIDEVQRLRLAGCRADMTSMQGIGYKQIYRYLDGEYDMDEAVRLIKRDSRHFAKRQLTWFNREECITWIDRRIYSDVDSQVEFIRKCIGEK